MVDMSHYEKDENLQLTKELTEYCHARGIITEAEPGRINGGEDGVKVYHPIYNHHVCIRDGLEWCPRSDANTHSLGHRGARRHPHYTRAGRRVHCHRHRLARTRLRQRAWQIRP